ncbi:MAG: flavoprotein [Planctomycetota bacterium]|nr:flavoprotein [Planctomycetota bacterium]
MSNVLLAVSGSVSIYKACDLASKLTQAEHCVRVLMTKHATELIAPQLFEAVTGEPAFTSEWGRERKAAMDHIDLAKWGDLLLVAPCSADLIARLAHGMADDLITTVALALPNSKPRFACPAMNPVMLESSAVQRNLTQLALDGWRVMAPGVGNMACGDHGAGRLPEPGAILEWIASFEL